MAICCPTAVYSLFSINTVNIKSIKFDQITGVGQKMGTEVFHTNQ